MAAPLADHPPVVLVVDDEPLVLRFMERALSAAGYPVHTAANGLRALEVATSLPVPPAVVVTDLRMDPVDGASLALIVRSRFPATRFLFVSGYDPEHLEVHAPFLRKPFSPADLVAAVSRLLANPAPSTR